MITGTVKSTTGETLPGASVFISDANGNMAGTIGAITDANGNFIIPAANTGQYYTASYIGYKSKTVQALYNAVNFVLEQTSTTLPGPTVTGQGKLNKNVIFGLFAGIGLLAYVTTAEHPFSFLSKKT